MFQSQMTLCQIEKGRVVELIDIHLRTENESFNRKMKTFKRHLHVNGKVNDSSSSLIS